MTSTSRLDSIIDSISARYQIVKDGEGFWLRYRKWGMFWCHYDRVWETWGWGKAYIGYFKKLEDAQKVKNQEIQLHARKTLGERAPAFEIVG